jgi:molybdopterin molybdotransferase
MPLSSAALGHTLAEDVASDIDLPPYDKALMDGYAVRCADVTGGQAVLQVIEEITAGQVPRHSLARGQAARIMTGAPVPQGADAVIMIERTRLLDGEQVQIDEKNTPPGQNVLPRARELRRGERVLGAGTRLRPQELGMLAAVGRASVMVHPRPTVAVLATGDELVAADTVPGPGQIRNGNGPMLEAQVHRAGGIPISLAIAPDQRHQLLLQAGQGLRSNVLTLAGGVSAGKLDLVPGVLHELGVQGHFHKIAMKPGKPLFFGTRDETLVFGLPGNPVSAYVCFELFVRPALRVLQGQNPGPRTMTARWAEDFPYATDRPTYHPVRLEETPDGRQVWPVPWFGSADLRALTRANALAAIPAGDNAFRSGQSCSVLAIEE